MDLLIRRMFGPLSEKLAAEQLDLSLMAGPAGCRGNHRSQGGAEGPEHWRLISAEVSAQLDYEPGRFPRRRLVRRKYVRRGDPKIAPVIAAVPPSLQERCIVAPGLLAQIIVSKLRDHLPLYGQEAIF
jgi:hypothetical protein